MDSGAHQPSTNCFSFVKAVENNVIRSYPYSTGHVALTEEFGNVFRISDKGTRPLGKLGIDGRIILKLVLK
jgi:hypothetical protein